MNCLVTGGAGFIGSHIVDELIKQGHSVTIIDNLSSGNINNINPSATFFKSDILDSQIKDIMQQRKIEIVFHLAAQINVRKSIESPYLDAENNILGSLNLLDACINAKVKKIIFSSTGGALYGEANVIPTPESYEKNPESPYGIAKLTIEKYIKFYNKLKGIDYTILRYANVYGPRQNAKGEAGVISIFINNVINNKPITIFGDGTQIRDYVFVLDVVKANILAINNSGVFNVGTGAKSSVNDLVNKLKIISKKEIFVNMGEPIKGELKVSCLDCNKIRKLGWVSNYSLDKGLNETYAYFLNENNKKN